MYVAGEQQQKKIATIKPRTITLNLSDADCERIAKKAGVAWISVSELLTSFIGDLEEMQSMKEDVSYYEEMENPNTNDLEDLKCVKEVLEECQSRIDEIYSDYVKWCGKEKPQSKEDAINGVIAWCDELLKLKGERAE